MNKKSKIMNVKKICRAVFRYKLLLDNLKCTQYSKPTNIDDFYFLETCCWRGLRQQKGAATDRRFLYCTQKSSTFITANYSHSNCDRANL